MDEKMLKQWLDAIDTIEEVKFDLIRHEDEEEDDNMDWDNPFEE